MLFLQIREYQSPLTYCPGWIVDTILNTSDTFGGMNLFNPLITNVISNIWLTFNLSEILKIYLKWKWNTAYENLQDALSIT